MNQSQKILGTIPTKQGRYIPPAQLPDPCGYKPYDAIYEQYLPEVERMRSDDAAVKRAQTALDKAKTEYPQLVYEANVRGEKTPRDPQPQAEAKLEEALRAQEISTYAVCQTSEKLLALRDDEGLREHARAQWSERFQRVLAAADETDSLFDDLGVVNYLRSWTVSYKPTRAVAGRDKLTTFRRELAKLGDPQPHIHVSPKENLKLRAGEDAVDVNGRTITYEEADHAYRLGRLHVSHGKLQPRDSTGWGDAG
jgi:hypothetical protein